MMPAAPIHYAIVDKASPIYTNFKNPQIEAMILSGIAWAAHYPVDTPVNGAAPVRTGGRGRRGQGGARYAGWSSRGTVTVTRWM